MNNRQIQNLKNAWRNTNNATVGFAQTVPTKMWHEKPFQSRFTTFSWEFACLLRTRLCYLEGLKTGNLSFEDRKSVPNKEDILTWDKKTVFEQLGNTAKLILEQIEKLESEEAVNMVVWLLQHERIHHGKLTLYHSQVGLKLPESFVKTWGKGNFGNL